MKVAIVIPHYQHHQQIGAVLDALVLHNLPIFVVDDGSDSASLDALASVLKNHSQVQLVKRESNGGKGAAVMTGCRHVAQSGFSHAFQIDADGQHALEDVKPLLALAKQYPQAIVSGAPQFAEDMPLSRRFGRQLTHFFVMLETLSRRVGDAMCGFRVYPLDSLMQLIDKAPIGARMDFDIEILVRADWQGIAIVHMPTRVHYPEHGVSHFHYIRDNIGITRLHTRLMFGMLLRSPSLLWRHVRQ